MHDLVALGEVMLRLSIPSPARFETIRQLDVQIGGAEANVAAACARLGLRAAWLSALPANPWGERIRRELTAHGVQVGPQEGIAPGAQNFFRREVEQDRAEERLGDADRAKNEIFPGGL